MAQYLCSSQAARECEVTAINYLVADREHLICTSHGATYKPDTGLCSRGSCKGLSLIALKLIEKDKSIYFDDKEYRYHV